jgi:hypothetical protein
MHIFARQVPLNRDMTMGKAHISCSTSTQFSFSMNHERRHKDRPTWISLASDVSSVLYRGGIRIESPESEGHRSASASMGMLLRAHKLHDDYKLSQRNSLGCLRRSFPSSSKKSLRKPFSMERERRCIIVAKMY